MQVIAAMDIINGSCVRLRMGDYDQKRVYEVSPLEMAKRFADAGLERLHLVDLDGARAHHVVNLRIIEEIAQHTPLVIDVGGGLKSADDISAVFSAGAHMATLGTLAAKDRELTLELLQQWGPERLILGADCRGGNIAVSGWETTTDLSVDSFIVSYLEAGFTMVVSTEIERDGMLSGPALSLYRKLIEKAQQQGYPLHLIASGGIRNLKDLDELSSAGLSGAIIGKALYEGELTPIDVARWQQERS